jgi:osmoprotectant transport system permease protein
MLPIVRNMHAGLAGIDPAVREAAVAMGMSRSQLLWKVELPLASPTILAGIKTSTVLSIGFATLGAFVGAGGYGEPILTGIRLQDSRQILLGAVPAALMAVGSELMFEWSERFLVPRGLRTCC